MANLRPPQVWQTERVSRTFDCRVDAEREEGLRTAATVIGRGGLVVLPTDTLYGVAGDAFNPSAVTSLLAAKGRGRNMPPPVLIAGLDVLAALTNDLSPAARRLAEAFWPGGLTLIGWAQPSLAWDLGDTGGTVAVRVPDHPIALDLLRACGPLATSSANLSGHAPAATASEAREQLAADVEVYLEYGEIVASVPSTIVDATTDTLRVVRQGAVSLEQLRSVVPDVVGLSTDEPQHGDAAAQEVGQPAGQTSSDPTSLDQTSLDQTSLRKASEPASHYDVRAEYAARDRKS